jgi:hypothetical protein
VAFKHGRLAELWLNGVDVSTYFASATLNVKVDTADVTTFKAVWKAFITGLAGSTLTANGYYDSLEADKVRSTLQAAIGQASYFPAGAVAIGDQARLLNINSSDYKSGDKVGSAVLMDWIAQSTAPVGIGTCLAPLAVYGVGAGVALTGDGLLTSLANTTGVVAHLHVTAMTGGDTHTFKLQDSTTLGGAYTDIASGAFVNVTAIGSQRLVVPGTIRQFVRLMYTVAGHSATFGVAVART